MTNLSDLYPVSLSSESTIQASYDIAQLAVKRGVPGDIVECGVFAGGQCAAMARGLIDAGDTGRKIHLFDSFEGIPAGGEYDEGWPHPAGTSRCTRETTAAYMASWRIPAGMLVYHEGLFADTIPGCGIDKIAVLRLDGDLYESTLECLRGLYPRVSPGGWVIIDDFALMGCRRAFMNYLTETGGFAPVYWKVQ